MAVNIAIPELLEEMTPHLPIATLLFRAPGFLGDKAILVHFPLFCQAVHRSPHLGSYIHRLEVETTSTGLLDKGFSEPLRRLLDAGLLPSLNHWHFAFDFGRGEGAARESQHGAAMVVQRILGLPTMESVQIGGVMTSGNWTTILTECFALCSPKLVTISLLELSIVVPKLWTRKIDEAGQIPSQGVQPRLLAFRRGVLPWLEGTPAPMDWSRLETLALSSTDFTWLAASPLKRGILTRIHTLHVFDLLNWEKDAVSQCFDALQTTRSLRILEFTIRHDRMLPLHAFLTRVSPGDLHLERIVVHIERFHTSEGWLHTITQDLDGPAETMVREGRLTRLEVELSGPELRNRSKAALRALQRCFPKMGSLGSGALWLGRVITPEDNCDEEEVYEL
ncbi:hypothetical protein HMN09_01299600 [Mycena chlorophos]|uniref:Uncharacterized protein n=1 Tax=Mycena chlorophos TaxID=658473 RepID=A0A8H6S1C9_MYCCL|nr:hypothetical protein HMN09_01299600 [Mycena chlorophos]